MLALSAAGAEYSELRPIEVESRKLLSETIYPSYGALSWTMDSKSFLYDAGKVTDIKSPEIELNRKTRLHTLGTDVASDADFFSNESYPDLEISPKEFPMAFIDESYPAYVVGNVGTVQNEMRLFLAPTAQMTPNSKLKWSVLALPSDNLVRGIVFYKDHVYAVTHAGAPKYKIVRTRVDHPDWKTAETVVPEAKDSIQSITHSKSFLFVVYSNGIVGRLVKYTLDTGKASEVKLPASGTIDISCPDFRTDQCIVFTTSWIQPTTLYDFDAEKDTFTKSIFNTAISYPGFENLVTEEVEVPGHDGTMIPLSIIHRKDLKLDGSASAILEGYGAYGISYTPAFNVRHSIALHGVVLAYAHVRGGSEKGEAWYKAGYKTTKPNTWKDFISSAEYLIKKGYTSADKLAGTGTSAGGILISRAVTERPDLFAAVVCNVGVANALRVEFSPNGPVNTPEFGTVQDATEAQALYEMDGVQHVKAGVKYPAVLGVAGWNDPRVVPWQPGKFVAAMQAASTSGKPVLLESQLRPGFVQMDGVQHVKAGVKYPAVLGVAGWNDPRVVPWQPGKFVAAMQAASTSGKPAMLKVNYDNGHFTEEKIVTFRNFAGQFAFMLWQTGHKEFQPAKGSN